MRREPDIFGARPEEENERFTPMVDGEDMREPAGRRRARGVLGALVGLVVLAILAGAGWATWSLVSGDAPAPGEVPLVKADAGPFKKRPEDPGGLEVPYQDVAVFGAMSGREPADYEVLLPEPEKPVDLAPPPEPEFGDSLEIVDVMPGIDDGGSGDAATDEPDYDSEQLAELAAAAGAEETTADTGSGLPPVPTLPPERPRGATPAAETAEAAGTAETGAVAEAAEDDLSFDSVAAALDDDGAGAEVAAEPQQPATGGGPRIQIASFSSADGAEQAWRGLQESHGDLLDDRRLHVDEFASGGSTYFRLQVEPFASAAEARAMCDSLTSRGVTDCLVVKP